MKAKEEIRVEEYGLIEVLVAATVTWGLHDKICWKSRVSGGFLFNSVQVSGSWHDVKPIRQNLEGVYFRRLGEALPPTEVDRLNTFHHISYKRIPKRDW